VDADEVRELQCRVGAVCERHEFPVGHPREIKFGHAGRSHDSPQKPNWMLRVGMQEFHERRAFLMACLGELKHIKSLKLIAVAVDKRKIYGQQTAIERALEPMLERIEFDCCEHATQGIVIADEEQGERDALRQIGRSGSFYTSFPSILEPIMFTPSTESVGVQVADIVAGSVGRYLNSDDPGYIREAWPLFRRHPGDGRVQGVGLKVYPSGECADPPSQPVPWPQNDRRVHEVRARAFGRTVTWTNSGEPQVSGE
jgi:hypothetical protein